MTAYLLKREGRTIAGLKTTEVVHNQPGAMSLAGRGVFVSKDAERQILNDALTGRLDKYEMSFEDGRRLTGEFRVSHLRKGNVYAGETLFDVTLATLNPIEVLAA